MRVGGLMRQGSGSCLTFSALQGSNRAFALWFGSDSRCGFGLLGLVNALEDGFGMFQEDVGDVFEK